MTTLTLDAFLSPVKINLKSLDLPVDKKSCLRLISENLPINRFYLADKINHDQYLVIGAGCGSGKTLGWADLASCIYQDVSMLFVAETQKQLDRVYSLLIELEVPKDRIAKFHSKSPDYKLSDSALRNRSIILITHYRLLIEDPFRFITVEPPTGIGIRDLMVIDEAVKPAIIATINRYNLRGLLEEHLGFSLNDILSNPITDRKEILRHVDILEPIINKYASLDPAKFEELTTIKIHDVDIKGLSKIAVEKRKYIIRLMFMQILYAKVTLGKENLIINIPIAPQLTWLNVVKNIVVLDATVRYNSALYGNFKIVEDFPTDYSLVEKTYRYFTDIDLTKTKIRKNIETFIEDDVRIIAKSAKDYGFTKPYVITFLEIEKAVEAKFLEIFSSDFKIAHYGMTRGSIEYADCESVVMIGAYRLPSGYETAVRLIFPGYDIIDIAIGNWIQELLRACIRNGKPVKLLIAAEAVIIKKFIRETGIINISNIFNKLPREILESIYKNETLKIRKEILERLKSEGRADIKEIAKLVAKRDVSKVKKAYRGLIRDQPVISKITCLKDDIINFMVENVFQE